MSEDPQPGTTQQSRRERAHERTTREIKQIALQQLESGGAGSISMNAIARELGMTGPALFRYFPTRDALLTDLVVEAYEDLATALERDITSEDPRMAEEILRRQAASLREWALANASRYLFIFGTPVPGFQPPPERTAPAAMRLLVAAIAPLAPLAPETWSSPDAPFERELEQWASDNGVPPMPGRLLQQAFLSWTRLHGILSLELVGHFTSRLPDPAKLYQAEADELIEIIREYLPDRE
jgi:AcrR family transcriptional regulator